MSEFGRSRFKDDFCNVIDFAARGRGLPIQIDSYV